LQLFPSADRDQIVDYIKEGRYRFLFDANNRFVENSI